MSHLQIRRITDTQFSYDMLRFINLVTFPSAHIQQISFECYLKVSPPSLRGKFIEEYSRMKLHILVSYLALKVIGVNNNRI